MAEPPTEGYKVYTSGLDQIFLFFHRKIDRIFA